MAYIGQEPVNTFSQVPTKDSFTGDGSTTTFDLGNAVVSSGENSLEVFVNNVRQEPGSGKAFTLGVDGNNELIKFSETLEKVCVECVENGFMTKDLAILIGPSTKFQTTNQFLDEIDGNLKKKLN